MPYIKEAFDVVTFDQAKHVVLSTDPNDPEKFNKETKFLLDEIEKQVKIDQNMTVLDFGCGMGRVSKEIIYRYNSRVFGVDISVSMLLFAKLYVANPVKFTDTTSYYIPESIDIALSIFALQHAEDPKKELNIIINSLKANGIFILLNENKRLIPNGIDSDNYIVWHDDRFDVFQYCQDNLEKIHETQYMNGPLKIIFYRKTI